MNESPCKVCLIRPPAVESLRLSTSSVTPPLGLAYVAGALEAAGHEVHVIDAVGAEPGIFTRYIKGFLIGLELDEIVARIPRDADLVGITVGFTHEWPAVVRLIERIKLARPELPVVVGGEHVTALPEFCLFTSKADFAVCGEGEETIQELADALRENRSCERIQGLGFRDQGEVVLNPRRPRNPEVDDIPWPAWHLFDLAAYHKHHYAEGVWSDEMTIPVLATRGCPYQCTYCSSPNTWTTRWVPRDPKKVADEIEHHVRVLKARNFPLHDLTAVIRRDWILAFCRELVDRGLDISWQLPSGTRLEAIDAEVAGLMARSGLTSMAFAPESASKDVRHWIKKRMRDDHLDAAVEAATDAGLLVSVFFIIGFPLDSPESLAHNLPYLDRLAEQGVSDVSVTFFLALPGTELFLQLFEAGRIRMDRDYFRHIPDGLNVIPLLSFCEPLSRLALARWKLRIFLRFYRRRSWRTAGRGLWPFLKHALSGLGKGRHESRLQTAFRSAATIAWRSVKSRWRKPWIPRREERALFEGWHETYEWIRAKKKEQGIRPVPMNDPARPANIVPFLREDHGTARRIPPPA